MEQTERSINILIRPEYETFIFQYRGFKVMIDSDLAKLYDVPTKRLKEQVKRNVERFPEDFMFELTNIERGTGRKLRPVVNDETFIDQSNGFYRTRCCYAFLLFYIQIKRLKSI